MSSRRGVSNPSVHDCTLSRDVSRTLDLSWSADFHLERSKFHLEPLTGGSPTPRRSEEKQRFLRLDRYSEQRRTVRDRPKTRPTRAGARGLDGAFGFLTRSRRFGAVRSGSRAVFDAVFRGYRAARVSSTKLHRPERGDFGGYETRAGGRR